MVQEDISKVRERLSEFELAGDYSRARGIAIEFKVHDKVVDYYLLIDDPVDAAYYCEREGLNEQARTLFRKGFVKYSKSQQFDSAIDIARRMGNKKLEIWASERYARRLRKPQKKEVLNVIGQLCEELGFFKRASREYLAADNYYKAAYNADRAGKFEEAIRILIAARSLYYYGLAFEMIEDKRKISDQIQNLFHCGSLLRRYLNLRDQNRIKSALESHLVDEETLNAFERELARRVALVHARKKDYETAYEVARKYKLYSLEDRYAKRRLI